MQINLLPISPVSDKIPISLYTEKADSSQAYCLYSYECPEWWRQHPEFSNQNEMYFSFDDNTTLKEQAYKTTINLYEAPHIACCYFKHLLYNYFQNHAAAVGTDYTGNPEIWIKDTMQPDPETTRYLKFSLAPRFKNMSAGFELMVSFNGYSETYNRSIAEIDIDPASYSKVTASGKIIKYRLLTPEHKNQITRIFPVINRALVRHFGLKGQRTKPANKYVHTYEKISAFCKDYLFVEDFNILNIQSKNFLPVPKNRIRKVSDNSNVLMFGNNQTDRAPQDGISKYGPFMPTPRNNVKFFFIAHRRDKDVTAKLYNIFKEGYEKTVNPDTGEIKYKFKPIAEYIKQPFITDKDGNIFFESLLTAKKEISTQLQVKKFEKNYFYMALYIGSENDPEIPYDDIYFKIKELLLEKNIISQTIMIDFLNKPNFESYLQNIATTILAKIGGIPWQLKPEQKQNDLIMGLGAFKSEKTGKRYIGSAFCLNKNGIIQNINCYRDNDFNYVLADIHNALGYFIRENREPERLIIHYRNDKKNKDAKFIADMLFRLDLKLKLFIITISKTKADTIVFDGTNDKMPLSGTIIPLNSNEFLLYNNSKYKEGDPCDYLFPIKVKIEKINFDRNSTERDASKITESEATEMLNHVYQFSRMYWKSVKQQNLPVTVKYPEMIARIVPHFSDAELPPFGKTNLWFL